MKTKLKSKQVETCKAATVLKPVECVPSEVSLACPACGRQSLYLIKAVSGTNAATTGYGSEKRLPEANGVVRECTAAGMGISVDLKIESADPVMLRRQIQDQNGVMVSVKSGPMYMNQLLDALFELAEFGRMAGSISVPDQGEYPLATFFQSFANANAELIDSYRGFWGTISSAKKTGTSVYFNTGGPDRMIVVLDERHEDEVIRKFGISSYANLVGARMLVFGELKKATSSEKLFVLITDPSRFTLRLAR
ncbi:MAG: hypothetical protein IPQ16_11145 [Geobacteraceae bacterium]|nr:hypothetical protein [Geobacteraceae bacterium]